MIAVICNAFDCLPSVALRELEINPWPLVLDVIELRSFADAHRQVEKADDPKNPPEGPWVDMVMDMQTRLMRESGKKKGIRVRK